MSRLVTSTMDDRALRELAAEPPQPLFPALRQADAMAPLVIVLAFLPTLYAVAHRTLTEAGALQGLISLQCLTAESLDQFIDPTVTSLGTPLAYQPLSMKYQPLLMNWFTALALNLFGVGQVAGHAASAYLCTAGLILATYLLGRRMGGDRLGLFSALLLAFNPHVLQLAQEPLPQSAAALFAVLALAGTVAHWQKSASPASTQLLLGGIALGLCLLAGGPAAIAAFVSLLIYATWWKIDGWRGPGPGSVFDRSQISRGMALRSVGILAATGFAVGGWRSLLMGQRYGAEFWHVWLGLNPDPGGDLGHGAVFSGWGHLFVRWNYLVLPLSVLSLAGAGVIVRELWQRTEDPGRRHRGLLLAGLFVAGTFWLLQGPDSEARFVEFWTILSIVPLVMLAAVAILALTDRVVPVWFALLIGVLTCVDVAWIAERGNTTIDLDGLAVGESIGWTLSTCLAVAGIAIVASLARLNISAETRHRGVLVAIVLGTIGANCVWGAVAVRRSNAGDRELDELRTGFARINRVARWTLVIVNPVSGPAAKPPPQLEYVLSSLWPEAEMSRVESWEELVTELSDESHSAATGQRLIVTWTPFGRPRTPIPAGTLKAAALPFVYLDHEVATFVFEEPVR